MTVDNLAVNRVIVAEQTAHGFHIALFQLFPCPGAADLAAVFLCFFDDLGFKTKGRAHFFQHFGCAASLVAKTEILSHNNFFRVQLIHQNLFDKGFRRHVHHFIHKRAFHKAVHAKLFEAGSSLLIRQQLMRLDMLHFRLRRHVKRKHNRFQSFRSADCKDTADQKHMPPVEAVKFPQGYNAVPSAVKIQCFC